MKAVEVKTELKFVFLDAAKACGLQVEELKHCRHPERVYYRINKPNLSMNDIFKLGIYFAEMSR